MEAKLCRQWDDRPATLSQRTFHPIIWELGSQMEVMKRKLFLKKEKKNLVKTVENENNVLVRETNEDFPAEDFQFCPFFSRFPL